MAKPFYPVTGLGKKTRENMLTSQFFFLLLKNKQLALQYVHAVDQEMYPLLKR